MAEGRSLPTPCTDAICRLPLYQEPPAAYGFSTVRVARVAEIVYPVTRPADGRRLPPPARARPGRRSGREGIDAQQARRRNADAKRAQPLANPRRQRRGA